jgi:hypothetical protein
VIRNFRFEPDGALAAPDWRRDKEGKTEYGPVSIVGDMRVGVENLLVLAEDIIIMWAIDHAAFPGPMAVSVIPEGAPRFALAGYAWHSLCCFGAWPAAPPSGDRPWRAHDEFANISS